MSRAEAPVRDGGIRAMGRLATHLRGLRDAAGYTCDELAEELGVSVSTVRRAASGRDVPKPTLIEAWAQACGAPQADALALWRRARYQHRLVMQVRPRIALPRPDLISRPEQLSEALEELYERAGAPTIREMAKHGPYGVLPRSTAHRIVHRQTLPATEKQCRAFLGACHVRHPDPWVDAWRRLTMTKPERLIASLFARLTDQQKEQIRHGVRSNSAALPSPHAAITEPSRMTTEPG